MKMSNLVSLLNSMPAYANKDIIRSTYFIIIDLVRKNSLANISNTQAALFFSVIFSALGLLIALGLAYCLRKKWLTRNLLIFFLLAVVLFNTAITIITSSHDLRSYASKAPVAKTYGYDAIDYLKIYYLMQGGQGYYAAWTNAFIADARNPRTDSFWLNNPVLVRQPWLFYIWKFTASNGQWLVFIALGLAASAIVALVLTINLIYGLKAASVSLLLIVPYLFMASVWVNVFFPDWWASMIILLAIAAMLSHRYKLSAVLALLAGLFRESMIFFTLAAITGSLIKRDFKAAAYYGISSVTIVIAFIMHYFLGSRLLPPNQITAGSRFSFGVNLSSLYSTSSYLMFPYGFFKLPAMIIVLFCIVACMRIGDRLAGWSLTIFLLLFIGYALFANASSYWGQQFLPSALMLLPLLVWPTPKLKKLVNQAY